MEFKLYIGFTLNNSYYNNFQIVLIVSQEILFCSAYF